MATIDDIKALFQRVLQRDASDAEATSLTAVVDSGALTLTQARDSIVNSAEANSFVDPAIRLYQAAFNRVPDQAGLDVNVDFLRGGGSIQDLANAFVASPEFTARFGGTTVSTAFLEALYVNVLGRPSDAQGLAGFLASGLTAGQILVAFSESVEFKANTDAAVTTFLQQAADGLPVFTGGPLGGGITGTPGSVFSFTTAPDALVGTTNNDIFNGAIDTGVAANNTFTLLDTVEGGAGTNDALNIISVTGGALPATTVSGIETLNMRALANSTVDVNNLPGVTTINSVRSTANLVVGNATNATTVGIVTDGLVSTRDLDVDYVDGATSATINIGGGVKNTSLVDIDGIGLTSVTVNSTGAANALAGFNLNGTTATTITINATTAIDTGAGAGFIATNAAAQSLVVTGTAADTAATATARANSAVNFDGGVLDGDFATVDASGLTGGGISATIGTATQKITGGGGDDQIRTDLALTTGSVDAAGGTNDLLIVTDSADVATASLGGKYTNFEVLEVLNAQTVDLGNIAGITSIFLNDGAGATAVTDLSAAQADAVTQLATNGAVTIGVKGATTVGQIDTVTITTSDGDTTTSENIGGASTPTLAGVENLIINAIDDAVFTLSAATTPNLSSIVLTGAGDHTLVTGNVATANTTIDGSAATGIVNVNAGAFATNGVAITGGTGADILTGSAQADVIVGGAGKDTIAGGDGEDTLTGGADADIFQFAAGDLSVAPSGTIFDTITDFAKGEDIIDDTGAALTVVVNGAAAAVGVAAINAEGIATFAAADDTLAERIIAAEAGIQTGAAAAGQFAIFEQGTDSYVYISDGVDGVAAADNLIKLTGVTGLTDGTLTAGDLTIA